MPSKRVVPQSSDSDAPIVVTPRKNTTSLSALLAQDVLLSRPSSKQAPRAAASGGALSPATPSHAAKLASPAAAPPKLAKFAAAAARRRAANPRTAAASVTAPKTAGPLQEISPASFYGEKDQEWRKRLARIVGASAAGVQLTDREFNESYLTRVKLVPKPFEKPNNRGNSKRSILKVLAPDQCRFEFCICISITFAFNALLRLHYLAVTALNALDFRDDPKERKEEPIKTPKRSIGKKSKGGRPRKGAQVRPTKDFVAVAPVSVVSQTRKFSQARSARSSM